MKTLDEVINIFEKACDIERRCEDCSGCLGQEEGCPNDGANAVPDALHHLKEYQEMLNNVENDPLEWEEIRIMAKKPIWVEYHGMNRWVIPEEYRHDVIGREYILVQDGGMMFRFQQHEVWEAYRKERK